MSYLAKNKISKGLTKLLSRKEIKHFNTAQDDFLIDERSRETYLKQFNEALVVELSEHI